LADHLGSSTIVTSSTGAVVSTMTYYPYGVVRSATGQMPTDKLFISAAGASASRAVQRDHLSP
jgi:hypothetical protein